MSKYRCPQHPDEALVRTPACYSWQCPVCATEVCQLCGSTQSMTCVSAWCSVCYALVQKDTRRRQQEREWQEMLRTRRLEVVALAARTWAVAHRAMEPEEPLTIDEARARLRAEYQARVALVAAVEALGEEAT